MMPGLKERIRAGEPTIGSWLNLGNAAVAEIMVRAGFDWLVVDLEHTVTTLREAEAIIRIVEYGGAVPLVRVSANDPTEIKRVMDAGAAGVIVPMVETGEEAERAVRSVRYPPLGSRGVGIGRAHGYGPGFDGYLRANNDRAIVVVQIESITAIENLDNILAVDGVDATMIGPYDLSASLGVPGQFDDPEVVAALRRYEVASRTAKVPMGFHVVHSDPQGVEVRRRAGYSFLAYGVDFLFLGDACRNGLGKLRPTAEIGA